MSLRITIIFNCLYKKFLYRKSFVNTSQNSFDYNEGMSIPTVIEKNLRKGHFQYTDITAHYYIVL